MFGRNHRHQLFATIFANFTTFAYGIAIGWCSPNLPRLFTTDTPLASKQVLTMDEVSWIGSIHLFGGCVSSLFFGWTAEKYGRKVTIIGAALPQAISWVIVEYGTSFKHLFLARLLVGLGGGGCFVAIPIYVSELASDKIRGALGALIVVSSNLGLVVGYAANSYLDYYTVPFIVLSILVVFFVGFPFACESPKHLVMQHNLAGAEKALKYFRGYGAKSTHQLSNDLKEELEGLRSISAKNTSESLEPRLTWSDFSGKAATKGILIGVLLNFLTIMNGVVAITNYSETVFVDAGSTLSPALSSIIVGFILLIGSYTSSILSDRVGRRLLMGVSATGCGVSLSVMGAYSYIKDAGTTTATLEWIPLACLSVFMLLGSIGIMSLHFVIMSEVLSQRIRGVISTFCLMENWMLAFISVKLFPLLLDVLGMQGCMLIFAVTCFAGTLFVLLVLPETKGKQIEAIIRELEGN